MTSYTIIYFDDKEQEHEVTVEAADAASALGTLLDDHDDIAEDSPFAIYLTGFEAVDLPVDLSDLLHSTGCDLQ